MSPRQHWHAPLSRRRFLQTAGSLAGALVGSTIFAREAGSAAASEPPARMGAAMSVPRRSAPTQDRFKIGVVLPQSELYPALGTNVLAGIQLLLQQQGAQAGGRALEIAVRSYGVSPAKAAAQARTLIEQDRADLLIGVVGAHTAALLDPLLRAQAIPLVMATIGANMVRPAATSPYIFRASLQQWQASWALGAWAARNLGRTAFIATSFYESGYDTPFAFQHGFETSGGTVIDRYVSHRPPQSGDLAGLIAAIERARPDVIYAAYSGRAANDFVQSFAQSKLSGTIPVVGSAFMVDDSMLPAQGSAALGIWSALSWSADLDLPQNLDFRAAYQARNGRAADAFAVLGYDTARLVVDAINAVSGAPGNAERFRAALGSTAFTGPRGAFAMNAPEREAASPLYLRTVRHSAGTLSNVVIDQLAGPTAPFVQAELVRSSKKTGWLNAYLCA